jgi:cyclopropane fatty-acyl-phospholipid synthase-like methyltransferase
MDETLKNLFLDIHSDMPRQGPGNWASTRQAWNMLTDLPPQPRILDLGCGPGQQTLDLLQLTDGTVTAVDNYQPYLDALAANARQQGLDDRIEIGCADMGALEVAPESVDVIWSEGAIYIIGFEHGLRLWQPLLKPGGYVAVSEITWLRPDPPEELKQFWEVEYQLRDIDANLASITRAGYEIVGHFALPETAWWDDYYTPLERRLARFRESYREQPQALEVIEAEQREIEMYRRYAAYYGYVFYIMRKP